MGFINAAISESFLHRFRLLVLNLDFMHSFCDLHDLRALHDLHHLHELQNLHHLHDQGTHQRNGVTNGPQSRTVWPVEHKALQTLM